MGLGTAVVTGASSGIGAATVRRLRAEGFDVVATARRADRLAEIAGETGARGVPLDLTDRAAVDAFAADVGDCRVLVNNAGGAVGLDPIESASDDDWQRMYDVNVLGSLRMTLVLPHIRDGGHIVNLGSIAGRQAYPSGSSYIASKFAVRGYTYALREDLLGRPIRVTTVDAGLVETEFSLVRFGGDAERAAAVYAGVPGPLSADDIADRVAWVVTRPWQVNIDSLVVRPRAQAATHKLHRET